jgi:hypothetical protein
MLTSTKIGKQNGDTRTRKPEPVYFNLSNNSRTPYCFRAWCPRVTRERQILSYNIPR